MPFNPRLALRASSRCAAALPLSAAGCARSRAPLEGGGMARRARGGGWLRHGLVSRLPPLLLVFWESSRNRPAAPRALPRWGGVSVAGACLCVLYYNSL